MRALLGWIRDVLSRLLGGGRSSWDLEPEAATVPDEPVLRAAPTWEEEEDSITEQVVVAPVVESAPEPEPEPEQAPAPSHLPLDAAGVGAAIGSLVVAGAVHPVTSWREAVLVAAGLHLEARGSLPETGYSQRQRSAYAYRGDAPRRFFEDVGGGWYMKTKFNAQLAATVTRHLLVEAGHDPESVGYQLD